MYYVDNESEIIIMKEKLNDLGCKIKELVEENVNKENVEKVISEAGKIATQVGNTIVDKAKDIDVEEIAKKATIAVLKVKYSLENKFKK